MRKNAKSAGRPPYKPTAAQKRQVATGAAGGMSHEEIAIGLGISRNTLEKHFESELSVVAYRKRLEMLEAMFATGKKGNVAAQKAFLAMTPHLSAPPIPRSEPVLGKKDQANADAITAQEGTEWSDLLPSNVVAIR